MAAELPDGFSSTSCNLNFITNNITKHRLTKDAYSLKSNCAMFLIFIVVGPILRMSPPPTEMDYSFTLAVHEGLMDLYDLRKPMTSTNG